MVKESGKSLRFKGFREGGFALSPSRFVRSHFGYFFLFLASERSM